VRNEEEQKEPKAVDNKKGGGQLATGCDNGIKKENLNVTKILEGK